MRVALASFELAPAIRWLRGLGVSRAVLVPSAARALPDRDAVVSHVADPLRDAGVAVHVLEPPGDDPAPLARAEAVVLGGGDPFALRAALRRSGADAPLRAAAASGAPMLGLSAGAMVLAPDLAPLALTSPFPVPSGFDAAGLGLVPCLALAHHDRPGRAARHHAAARRFGRRLALLPLADDEVAFVEAGGPPVVRTAAGLALRGARPEDAEGLAAVFTAAARAAWASFLPPALDAFVSPAARWAARLREPALHVRVAADDLGICGFAATRPAPEPDLPAGTGELALLYAHPRAWGAGVGPRLLDRALFDLHAAGCREAVVWTEERNARALALYARLGWRPDGAVRARTFLEAPIRERRLRLPLDDGGRGPAGASR